MQCTTCISSDFLENPAQYFKTLRPSAATRSKLNQSDPRFSTDAAPCATTFKTLEASWAEMLLVTLPLSLNSWEDTRRSIRDYVWQASNCSLFSLQLSVVAHNLLVHRLKTLFWFSYIFISLRHKDPCTEMQPFSFSPLLLNHYSVLKHTSFSIFSSQSSALLDQHRGSPTWQSQAAQAAVMGRLWLHLVSL